MIDRQTELDPAQALRDEGKADRKVASYTTDVKRFVTPTGEAGRKESAVS